MVYGEPDTPRALVSKIAEKVFADPALTGWLEQLLWPRVRAHVDAWRRVYPDRMQELRPIAISLGQHLASSCIGTISEIFDAEPPYTPRGCVAQAWSVAEVLRSMIKLAALKKRNELTKVA